MITGMNYIGSKKSAQGEVKFSTFNPKSNTRTHWEFVEATEEEINEAMQLAAEAFALYQEITFNDRAKFLRQIASEIENLGDVLIDAYLAETGLAEGRAKGERARTIGQIIGFAELLEDGSYVNAIIETADKERSPAPKPDIRTMSIPLGPIVVFGSSNFPLAFSTAGGDSISALAAGCPVIVKCHPYHAATSELVAGAIITAAEKTGMPNGIFSHLFSKGHRVGGTLVSHPLTKAVGFTGSLVGGMALNKLVQQRREPIPFFAEMGSTNPVVILPSGTKSKNPDWTEILAGSIHLGAGQFCTNPGLIIGIKDDSFEKFIRRLGKKLAGFEPECMLHPAIHDQYQLKHYNLRNENEVTIVAEASTETANYAKQGLLAVNGSHFIENPKLHHEVFGPLSIAVLCHDEQELLQILSKLEGQLTGTILGEESEISQSNQLINALMKKVGRLIFNGVPTGVEVNPAMHHGGPFPSTTDSRYTSVGQMAIKRWLRPICYQNCPQENLPDALKDSNPLGIYRLVDRKMTKDPI